MMVAYLFINIVYLVGLSIKMINFRSTITLITLSIIVIIKPVNASVIRTIDGIETEWMELSSTIGMSRQDIETQLVDSNSSLYGYRYASRLETQSLFESYSALPSYLNVYYNYMASGAQAFFNDFGTTFAEQYAQTSQITTEDDILIDYNLSLNSLFLYGEEGECGSGLSCVGQIHAYALGNTDPGKDFSVFDGTVQAWNPFGRRGADAYYFDPDIYLNTDSDQILGSLLVNNNVSAVPLPAAFWLFSSGFTVLIGFANSRKHRKNT